jgi:large exoprotein involved in heme utilization and adhesion
VQSDVKFGANGNGGNIDIKARSLSMDNFSLLSTATSGQGNAGNISMQVDDSITLANTSNIRSNVEQGGVGNGGDIDIKARSLTLTKGAEIGAIVFREENGFRGGKGKAGNIVINAKDFVDISGVSSVQLPVSFPTVGFSSGIFASAERGTTATQPQAAGNITITTGNFNIANGAVVDALTSNDGSGGSITINAKNFTATGGGQVLTTSRGKGDAGDIILNISDRITLSGTDPNFNERFERASKFGLPDDIVNNQGSASGLFANTTAGSTGDGGTIFIDPRRMVIRDGAGVAVNSQGSGKGGDIRIQAGTLKLDNKAFISGETASNQGGNIKLSINDLLLLRRNSKISTSAGTAQAGGDGGNITINAPNGFIVAFPKENSDIAANAFEGSGGRVDITAFNLFNIQTLSRDDLVRLLGTEDPIQLDPQRLSSNDITAISQLNPTLNGDVNIQDINQDPTQGLELPEDLGDSSRLITQSCPVGVARATSRFVITGRGGLPPNPSSPLSSDVLIENRTTNTPPQATHLEQSNSTDSVLVEAQGVDIGTGGEIIFTAKPSKLNSYNPLQRNIGCYGQ